MKTMIAIGFGAIIGAGLVAIASTPFLTPAEGQHPGKGIFTVMGRTRCIAGNKAIIAPTVLHPVEEIHVALGDRVKKGDKLVQLDADEPKADVRAKEANLEAAEILLKEAS